MSVNSVNERQTIEGLGLFREEPSEKTQEKTSVPVNDYAAMPVNSNIFPDFRSEFLRFQLNQNFVQPQTPPNQLGDLKEGDRVNIIIGENATQADVLRAAYTEFARRAGVADPEDFANSRINDDSLIYHPGTNTAFTAEEFAAYKAQGSINIIATKSNLTALRQTKLEELTSYAVFDWAVTSDEQRQVVDILRADPNLSDTIKGLENRGALRNLIDRVDDSDARRALVDLLGRNLDAETAEIVRPHIENLDVDEGFAGGFGGTVPTTDISQNLWQVRFNLARLGITPTATSFDRSRYADLISSDNAAAFSGVGATGFNPTDGSVPLGDQWSLWWENAETTRRYSNPLGNLNAYINSITPENRARQAELLVNQPVSTTMPEIYGGVLPSRADVIRAAANRYNLQPELVAAFILAEQRDQSRNEDAKDYTAATSLPQANTSIGLGQVVISTAQRNNLFSDLMSERTQRGMKHNDVARVLADDTANIFAVAKYLRQVANEGAGKSIADLPQTQRKFPNIRMSDYSNNSSRWTDDNIRALGSEYTSRAWDDSLSPGWGDFVLEAYRDVQRSGVFR